MAKKITFTVSIDESIEMTEEERKLRIAQFFALIHKWKQREKAEQAV